MYTEELPTSRKPKPGFSMRGSDESPVPGRFLLFVLDEGPEGVKRKGGVAGLFRTGDAFEEGEGCLLRRIAMLGEDPTGARVW